MMESLRWQWRLANRGDVTAVIAVGMETVSQGARVLSEAPRGSRVDGHKVMVAGAEPAGGSEWPPIEAVLTFDPRQPICVLRVDDYEVAPSSWPVRGRNASAGGQPSTSGNKGVPVGKFAVYILAGVALIAVGLLARARLTNGATLPAVALTAQHRSASGLFIAHFPADFEAKAAVLPSGVDGVLLEDKARTTAILITAISGDSSLAHDPWAIQQRLRDEGLANLPKGAARFSESSRGEETCFGEHGAAVCGQLEQDTFTHARVWSCAFARGASSYLMLTMVVESASAADHRRARTILEATELTQLAGLSAPQPAP